MRSLAVALVLASLGLAVSVVSSQATARYYVALGDSVAAGQGLQNLPQPNPCDRSTKAYPALLAANPSFVPAGTPTRSVACTGATTQNVLNTPEALTGATVAAQLAQVKGLALGTVTITAGVDNLDWTHRLTVCLTEGLAACKTFNSAVLAGIATVKSQVEKIVSKVRTRGATRVIVTGYFDPFPTASVGTSGGCDAIYALAIDNGLTNGTITLIRTWEGDLNTALKGAATTGGATFVSVTQAVPAANRVCMPGSWVIPLTAANVASSAALHPNAPGQRAIAARIVAVAPPA